MFSHSLRPLEKVLGHRFKKRELLVAALTHPSYRHESGGEGSDDNQRLEFLGDAVIGLLAAEHLYDDSQEMREGEMTKLRSVLTNRTGLASVGEAWELGPLLRMGKGEAGSGGAFRDSNLADAVEAVLGAVFVDGGIKAARKLYERHFAPRLETQVGKNPDESNPKGRLQEYTQRLWQENPEYRIVEERGPAHGREYVATVWVHGEEFASGLGAGKRAAEAAAAREALGKLQQQDAKPG